MLGVSPLGRPSVTQYYQGITLDTHLHSYQMNPWGETLLMSSHLHWNFNNVEHSSLLEWGIKTLQICNAYLCCKVTTNNKNDFDCVLLLFLVSAKNKHLLESYILFWFDAQCYRWFKTIAHYMITWFYLITSNAMHCNAFWGICGFLATSSL